MLWDSYLEQFKEGSKIQKEREASSANHTEDRI